MDIRDLLATTTNSVDKLHRKKLATIIFGRTKVVRNIQEAKQRKTLNVYQQALCNVFLDVYVIPLFFEKIGDTIAERDDLASFESHELSNAVWAYAIVLTYNILFCLR